MDIHLGQGNCPEAGYVGVDCLGRRKATRRRYGHSFVCGLAATLRPRCRNSPGLSLMAKDGGLSPVSW